MGARRLPDCQEWYHERSLSIKLTVPLFQAKGSPVPSNAVMMVKGTPYQCSLKRPFPDRSFVARNPDMANNLNAN